MSEDAAERQATLTAERVLSLLAAYEAGQLAAPDLTRGTAVAVYAGKIIASRLADILVSTLANLPPVGIRPGEQHMDRLTEAAETILSEPEGQSERLERLALAETVNSYRRSLRAAIRQQGFTHWERVAAEDPCEVCAPLAGEVQPVTYGFKDHPGCRCSLRPHGQPKELATVREEPAPRITMRRTITYA